MRSAEEVLPERKRLNFAHAVAERFGFLSEFGFRVSESLPTIVRYRKGDLELNVYHGRQSFEVGLQIGRGRDPFSMWELIRCMDQAAAERYRMTVAKTPAAVGFAVDQLADLLLRFGQRALRDEPQFFGLLEQQRQALSEDYALEVLAEQTRPKAEAAFREGRYREAAELYEQMAPRLTPLEQKKLAAARKRSGSSSA